MDPSERQIFDQVLDAHESDVESEPESSDGEDDMHTAPSSLNPPPLSSSNKLKDKVLPALQYLDSINLKTVDFLIGLSWGDTICNKEAKIQRERTILLQADEFPGIIRRWASPPRPSGSKNPRATGAAPVMDKFALEHIKTQLTNELGDLTPTMKSNANIDINGATLTETGLGDLGNKMKEIAPMLWDLLVSLATTERQREINTHKTPEKMVLLIIAMLLYSRSHHNNRLQKLLAIYLKFKGITAKGFDTLHALGLVMSHKWTCDSVRRISERCMAEVQELMLRLPWLWSYDNMTVAMRMFAQRVDQALTYSSTSSTAATVYLKPEATPLSATANEDLKRARADGMKNPLTALDIADLVAGSSGQLQEQSEYEVLRFLLDSPEFSLTTYSERKSDLLRAPAPVKALPTGPKHATKQYLLGSVNSPEASVKDNSRLILEWMDQAGLGSNEEKKKTGSERVIFWAGDQLTINRLRSLYTYRAEDSNPFD